MARYIIDLKELFLEVSKEKDLYWLYKDYPVKYIINELLVDRMQPDVLADIYSSVTNTDDHLTNKLVHLFDYINEALENKLQKKLDVNMHMQHITFIKWVDSTSILFHMDIKDLK